MKYIIIVTLLTLLGCSAKEQAQDSTEMTGEPVNIALTGQVEMCEREPESVLCQEEDE